MRTLLAGTNIVSADGTYPYGRVQDDAVPGDGSGTLANEILLGDVLVYFQKLMDYAGVTANGNPENEISGYQSLTALFAAIRAQAASTSQKGTVELSTNAEMITGTSTSLAPPVSAIANRMGGLITKLIEIGDWDMDATQALDVAHGLTFTKIRTVEVVIRDDANTGYYKLEKHDPTTGLMQGGVYSISSTNVRLTRLLSGVYDSTNYDSTGYNRGWITIQYEQ